MSNVSLAAVNGIAQNAETVQQQLTLRMAEPLEINTRLAAAVEHQLALQQDTLAEIVKDRQAVDKIVDAAVDQVIAGLLDPTRQVTAGGVDQEMAAALNDTTKTIAEEAANLMARCRAAIAAFQNQFDVRDQLVNELSPDLGAMIRSLVDNQSLDQQWRAVQDDVIAQGAPLDLAAAERAILDRMSYAESVTVQGLVDRLAKVGTALDQLNAEQALAFEVRRDSAILRLEVQQKEVAVDAQLAMALIARELAAQLGRQVEWVFAATFSDTNVGVQGLYDTTQRLVRGNLGERLAAEALAADGHQILMYKPDVAGTNQGGIDLVTMQDGVLYLIDNKALTRDGNVSSVSALTTNFDQNLEAIRAQVAAAAIDQARAAAERQLYEQVLAVIEAENFVRMVTNANIARGDQQLSGVTQRLKDEGIEFLNVWP